MLPVDLEVHMTSSQTRDDERFRVDQRIPPASTLVFRGWQDPYHEETPATGDERDFDYRTAANDNRPIEEYEYGEDRHEDLSLESIDPLDSEYGE